MEDAPLFVPPIHFFLQMSDRTNENCNLPVPIAPKRHMGKVQFLRLEHGYIRIKNKINGVRDVTFYYSDLTEELKETLALGSMVSFSIAVDANGRFCATDIEIEKNQAESPTSIPSIPSSSSIPSLESSTDDEYLESAGNSRKNSFSLSVRTPATMQQYLQQYTKPTESKCSINDRESLSKSVDHFLELVLLRKFDSSFNSCWLA